MLALDKIVEPVLLSFSDLFVAAGGFLLIQEALRKEIDEKGLLELARALRHPALGKLRFATEEGTELPNDTKLEETLKINTTRKYRKKAIWGFALTAFGILLGFANHWLQYFSEGGGQIVR
jgi:hypothetical protein